MQNIYTKRLYYWIKYAWKYKTLFVRKRKNKEHNARLVRRRKDLIAKVGKCQNCGKKRNLTIDHIIPKSKGGPKHGHHNLQVLCWNCNQRKADKIVNYAERLLS